MVVVTISKTISLLIEEFFMKKTTITLVIIALLTSIPMFGATSKVSVGGFYTSETIDSISAGGTVLTTNAKGNSLGAYVKGTSYFSSSSSIGMSYMARFGKLTSLKVSGTSMDVSDEPIGWDASIGVAFQQPINRDAFFEGVAGIMLALSSDTDNSTTPATTLITTLYSFTFMAELNYALSQTTFFNVGIQGILPLTGSVEMSSGGFSLAQDYSVDGFTLSPYVGVSMAF